MDAITNLTQIDFYSAFTSVIIVLLAFKFIVSLWEWFATKFGLETKKMRQRREDHELLIKVSENLLELQNRHRDDEETFRNNLENYMKESREDRKALHEEMSRFTTNRINDRQVSVEREQRLNRRIDDMIETDKTRDTTIDNINTGLNKLTNMFIDKEINDYRWEIINFATAISERKPCTRDGFKHCFATYEKYEKILEENGLENGEVEISMEIINEAYKERMLEGFQTK